MDRIRLYTCMVGKKPTHANFYVNDVSEVETVVAAMAGRDDTPEANLGGAGGEQDIAGEGDETEARPDALAG